MLSWKTDKAVGRQHKKDLREMGYEVFGGKRN
jgi:hypothetical protein